MELQYAELEECVELEGLECIELKELEFSRARMSWSWSQSWSWVPRLTVT